MVPRGAILQIAKMVGRDIRHGAPGPAALAAGSLLAQSGATPELVACLVAEAGKKRPAGRIVEACCFLLESALTELRIAGIGGDAAAHAMLGDASAAIEAAVAAKRLPSDVLMPIARAIAQAGLDPGPALRRATLAAMQDGAAADPASPPRGTPASHLAGIAQALGDDPFAIHAELAASGAAFPPEHRAAMAAELAASDIPALRDAALGFLLDAHPAPGAEVLEVLAEQARRHPLPSRVVERLVSLRPWLPPARQPRMDAAIRSLRANTAAPVPVDRGEVKRLLASLCDGAGAQSLFALVKTGRRYALASVLVRADSGVADAWVRDDMTKREADDIVAQITHATEAVDVSLEFAEMRMSDALATNLAREMLPPFGLLHVTEAVGRGPLLPAATSPMMLADTLLRGRPPGDVGPEATRAAHRDAADWRERFETVGSWFEAGEAIDTLLNPIPSRRKRIAAVLAHHLPGRRAFWAERCAWMAATLKGSGSSESGEWRGFALVARDLAAGKAVAEVPLFAVIAEATVDTFAAGPRTGRHVRLRGR